MSPLPGVRAGSYGPPAYFNWDWGSQDTPIQDDVCLDEYNVEQRIDDFVRTCEELANVTRGNDIMLTMGTDFQYSNAFVWCVGMLQRQVEDQGFLFYFYFFGKACPAAFAVGGECVAVTTQSSLLPG